LTEDEADNARKLFISPHTLRERLAGGSVRTAADAVARALGESV